MAERMKEPARISGLMALAALVAVVLAPPEAFGSGRMLLVVLATFAFLILAVEGSVPTRYLTLGAALWGVLLLHSLALSVDPYRSVEFLGLAWAYYCLFGVFRYAPSDLRVRACVVLVVLASAVSLYGLHQYLWGFDNLSDLVLASEAPETSRESILGLLANERVFATFALPGTLWGFLILTIPLHLALWAPGNRVRQAAVVANAVLLVAVAALTQSYGFILGLVVVAAGLALTRSRRALRTAILASAAAAPLAAGMVALLGMARASTHDPVWLRLQNWLSAWEIFRAHPFGAGLNSYAVIYPQFQQPGANETQFAHNTPVQLTAELGILALVALAPVVLYLARRLGGLHSGENIRRYLLVALMVWGVHNLMDINVYFGSLGAVGAALLGLFAWSPAPGFRPDPGRMRPFAVGAAGVLAALALVSSGAIFVSGELLVAARTDLEFGKTGQASETLLTAARINPFDSSIMHEAGQTELELYHRTHDPARLDNAQEFFSKAIRLSPLKVGPHIGLALSLASEDRLEEAIDQLRIAQMLHPPGAQTRNIRRLIELRRAGTAVR